jgi:5-hydroxyisourate hydrolase-like protein (transthyretin family)
MKRTAAAPRSVWSGAHKWFTGIVTTIAAVLTLLLNAKNLGLSPWLGLLDPNIADYAVRRVVLTPRADTLRSLGDSAVIVATVTDARGATLVGASLRWKTSDSTVASVDSSGTIIARAPGRATIEASVRDITTSAAVLVRQAPVAIAIAGDSAVRMADGDSLRLTAHVVDARGHPVRALAPRWDAPDSQVVRVDSMGAVAALRAGRTVLTASSGDLRRSVPVEVVLTPATIALNRGEGQRALAGKSLAEPLVLQVLTRAGQPVPGVAVSLTTEHGEGAVMPSAAATDAQGRVRAQWTLGTRAGVQRIFVRTPVLDSAMTVVADADPSPGNLRIDALAELQGTAGRAIDQPVRVRVTDTLGVALASVRVAWSALDDGTVVGSPQTDTAGYAEAQWTLGRRAGSQRLLVQVGNARFTPATTLRAKVAAGAATSMRVHAGDAQSAVVGSALPKAVVVLVLDSLGNPVAGTTVRATASAGELGDSLATTDADGRATLKWTLGAKAGTQRLELRMAPGAKPVVATAKARPGSAAAVALAAQKSGTAGAQRVTAQVSDQYGNAVRNAQLIFTAAAGKLSRLRVASDSLGRAVVTWTPPVLTAAAAKAKSPVLIAVSLAGTKNSTELRLR